MGTRGGVVGPSRADSSWHGGRTVSRRLVLRVLVGLLLLVLLLLLRPKELCLVLELLLLLLLVMLVLLLKLGWV